MPRQTPSSGVRRAATSRIAVSSPRARSDVIPAPNAPTPGRTRRAAPRAIAGSAVTSTAAPSRRNAPAIDARFATPESTITTSLTRRAQRAIERLAQRKRGVLGRVMIVDVQVAVRLEREIEPRMPHQRFQQMIEEADAGPHLRLARPVDDELRANRCLTSGALDD